MSLAAGACRQDERRRHSQSNHRSRLHPSLIPPASSNACEGQAVPGLGRSWRCSRQEPPVRCHVVSGTEIDNYLDALEEVKQTALAHLRDSIMAIAPDAEELCLRIRLHVRSSSCVDREPRRHRGRAMLNGTIEIPGPSAQANAEHTEGNGDGSWIPLDCKRTSGVVGSLSSAM